MVEGMTKKRVVVAMSGGVDSSVAAALLLEQGYQVIGVTMRLWDLPQEEAGRAACCSPEDIYDARAVANQLGIPFYVLNMKEAFQREVVDYFVQDYLRGLTPNPCIRCNDKLKFDLLLRRALELDAGYLATGHYARIFRPGDSEGFLLMRAQDLRKDQSYFLFTMNQTQLAKVLFPLGELTKNQVRVLAAKWQLKVRDKRESQEICFIPDGNYAPFIRQQCDGLAPGPGYIVNSKGRLLGTHPGIYSFTVGQRRGLGLTSSQPLYVLKIDSARNLIVVGPEEELCCRGFMADSVHWVSGRPLRERITVTVRPRYRCPEATATLTPLSETRVKVEFASIQKAVAPGQAAVFYRGDAVLGGGWIQETF